MLTICAEEADAARLRSVADRLVLVPAAPPLIVRGGRVVEDDPVSPSASMTLAEVVDAFWPAEAGWQLVEVVDGPFYRLFLMTHPTRGVGASLLGAHVPGESDPSEQSWARLDMSLRNQCVMASVHVSGSSWARAMQAMCREAEAPGAMLSVAEKIVAARLLDCALVMDPSMVTLRGLGAFDAIEEAAAWARGIEQRTPVIGPLSGGGEA